MKPIEITMLVLTIVYSLLVLIFLAVSDQLLEKAPAIEYIVQAFELLILFVFMIEICLKTIGYWKLYLYDRWNIIEIVIIFVTIIFIIIDIAVKQ